MALHPSGDWISLSSPCLVNSHKNTTVPLCKENDVYWLEVGGIDPVGIEKPAGAIVAPLLEESDMALDLEPF